jgi:TRAP-type C4-dicarboxylate transport system permease small subunit
MALPPLLRHAERAVDALAITLFVLMFGCVLGQVVFRYFLGSPLVWSDELARYLFVWCAFLGWIVAARKRSHLGVSVVGERLGPRGAAALRLVGALAAVAFAGVLVFYGLRIAARNLDVDTVALFFTIGAVYAIVPLAGIAVGLYALADAQVAVGQLMGRARQ